MVLIQLTGLSGSGKTTIAENSKNLLNSLGYKVEIIDGDIYRKTLCRDLSFSKHDRIENMKRMFFIGQILVKHDIIVIISAINPYEKIRSFFRQESFVKTVYVSCPLDILINRDPKGLYKKALLPDTHPEKIHNFTGISDSFERPINPDLEISTETESIEASSQKLTNFIINTLNLCN